MTTDLHIDPHILCERRGALGLVTLNRPTALNALTHGMVLALMAQLAAWAGDSAIAAVAIRGAGERAFCAGADIRAFHRAGVAGTGEAVSFLRDEYRLNAFIAAYPKPYIALLHGIVMGGGAGLSLHGRYRLADTSLDLAMPETGIGFVVDVGASYLLPRCPGEIGMYLALTGARIGLADALYAKLVTHAVRDFAGVIDKLAAGEGADAAVAAFAQKGGPAPLTDHRRRIDTLFAAASVEAILERLERDGSEFARGTAQSLRSRSPTAVKYTFRQMREGRALDLPDCLKMEFRLAMRALKSHDFAEGVRAALIDKDRNPHWQPSSFAAISGADIAAYFAPLGEAELQLA